MQPDPRPGEDDVERDDAQALSRATGGGAGEELDADGIRPPLNVWPRRDYFLEVVATTTDWVRTGIDPHPQSAAGWVVSISASLPLSCPLRAPSVELVGRSG